MSRICLPKLCEDELSMARALVGEFLACTENMLERDKRFLSTPMKKSLQDGKKLFAKSLKSLFSPIIQKCFDEEEGLRHIAQHIWENESFDVKAEDFKALVHMYLLNRGEADKLPEMHPEDSRHMSCSLWSKETPAIFGGAKFALGILIEPNDGFICAANRDTIGFEIPNPKYPEFDKETQFQHPMSLVYKSGEKKVFVGNPLRHYLLNGPNYDRPKKMVGIL